MNKSQKRIRNEARKQNGQTYNVSGDSVYTTRTIPQTRQPRLSKRAKVGAPAKSGKGDTKSDESAEI
jgi:hypothetical protein